MGLRRGQAAGDVPARLALHGGGQTLLLGLREDGVQLDYWGPALSSQTLGDIDPRLFERAVPHGMLDGGERLDLAAECGRGFTGTPTLEASRPQGDFITQMELTRVDALHDGWRLCLADAEAGVERRITVSVDPDTGVATFGGEIKNVGPDPLRVDWFSAVAIPSVHDEVLAFSGRWAGELRPRRFRLGAGVWASESRTGRTSHHAPPFLVVGESGFGEFTGEVTALHLGWSGDHRLLAERLRDGRLQLQAGELFWPGEMVLPSGGVYRTPSLYVARSDAGLNGLSDRLHPFVRRRILHGRLEGKPRPAHFNTWEAVYFRHDAEELKDLATRAAAVGVERFVLDDGWFEGRNDDTTSLGDWRPDLIKHPDGLRGLADHVEKLGMSFGLWVEPEMASRASRLLAEHPDWVLGAGDREQPLGRGQYVLDLTRAEVAEEIFRQLDRLLRDLPIGYLKWDMNRDLTHPASGGRPASHAQVLAVYDLIDRIRSAHPAVEIEACASGGGRADYEVLKRTDRIWTSDCNDPIERQWIQRSFSIFFPPEVMGTHVGPADSHTTARRASLEMRAFTALFGHLGIEADIRRFTPAELDRLAGAVALYKRFRPLLHSGRLVRQTPPDGGSVAFAVIGADEALASFAQIETPEQATPAPFRIVGLDPDALYEVELLNPPHRPEAAMKSAPALVRGEGVHASGRLLASVGLPMPILRAGEIAIYHLRATAR